MKFVNARFEMQSVLTGAVESHVNAELRSRTLGGVRVPLSVTDATRVSRCRRKLV